MAQVGRDRPQQVELALGEDEVLPGVCGLQMGGQLAQARGRGVTGAQVQVGGQRHVVAAHARRDQAHLAGVADLLDREPELRRHLARVVHAGEGAPRPATLGEGGVGHVHHQRGPVGQRGRLPARGAQQDEPLGALVDGAQQRASLGRRQVAQPVDAQPASRQDRGKPSVGQGVGLLQLARAEHHHRRAGGRRHHRPGIGAAHHQRQLRARRQQRGDLGDRVHAPHLRLGIDPPQARPGRRAQVAGPEQEGHEPVGHLDGPVGERRQGVHGHQTDRATAREATARLKAGQDIGRVDPLARQQLGGEARTGQPPGDVVLEVGVQAAVAGLQLRRDAQRQHRAVERVEAEPRHRLVESRARSRRPRLGGQRHRLLIGDVEAAERVVGVVAGRHGSLHRGLDAALEKLKPVQRGPGRRHTPVPVSRCPGRRPRPRVRACRPVARRSAARCSAPPAAARRAPTRGRAARALRLSRAGTRRPRRRCRCPP